MNKVFHYVILRYKLNYPTNSIKLADYKSRKEAASLRSASLPVEFFPEKSLDKATTMSHNVKNDISVAK